MGHMGHEASVAAALGLYKPRRPHGSPLFRLVSDHMRRLQTVYDERFAREPRRGDRPDSDAPPHPRRLGGSAERAESALDRLACGVVAPRAETRHTSTTPIEFPILPGISSGLGVIDPSSAALRRTAHAERRIDCSTRWWPHRNRPKRTP
jgi:hypothetical protein